MSRKRAVWLILVLIVGIASSLVASIKFGRSDISAVILMLAFGYFTYSPLPKD